MPLLHHSAVLVNLSITGTGGKSKTDKRVTAEVCESHATTADSVRVLKQLLPKTAFEALAAVESEARAYHAKHSLPWTDEGARILPCASFIDYTAAMRDFRHRYELAVEEFLATYDDLIEVAQRRLNGMFNAKDYPEKDAMRARFKFKTDFLPFPTAADFRVDLPSDEITELRANVDQRIAEAKDLATRDIWKRLGDPVARMAERLGDPDNKFKDSLVGNLREILRLVPALNIAGDDQLEAMRQRIADELVKHGPDTLRHNRRARAETAAAAQDILTNMAAYLEPDSQPSTLNQPLDTRDTEVLRVTPPVAEATIEVRPLEFTRTPALPSPPARDISLDALPLFA